MWVGVTYRGRSGTRLAASDTVALGWGTHDGSRSAGDSRQVDFWNKEEKKEQKRYI